MIIIQKKNIIPVRFRSGFQVKTLLFQNLIHVYFSFKMAIE